MDFIFNGQANGSVAAALLQNNFDASVLRPWIGTDGRSYVTRHKFDEKTCKVVPVAVPVTNTTATLRKDEWIQLDERVIGVAKERLNLVADLQRAGLTYNVTNGMGKTILETETMGDITPATISMDGLRRSQEDRPQFELTSLPLPIIHKDFSFSARQIAASRNSGGGIDTTTAELAARRVAEEIEKLATGSASSYSYGGGTIYGLTNFPQRTTTVMVHPQESDWTPEQTVDDVLEMRQACEDNLHYGPWVLYNAPSWDRYLDKDYSENKGDNTLRERIQKIRGIQKVQTLDHLSGYQMVLVQQTSDVIREVIGLGITTVQWETQGGMMVNFKVMAIMVPQLRADQNDNSGIVHGTPA